jgi:hypothetical protein
MITAHNVTIDGYSQPGAVPNTNPILSNNNAQIKIVLSATNSVNDELYRDMDYNSGTNSLVGYTPGGEFGLLGVYGATNVKSRDVLLRLGKGGHYAIALARCHASVQGVHVSGCWIGVEPSGARPRLLTSGAECLEPICGISTTVWRRSATGMKPHIRLPGRIMGHRAVTG